MTNGETISVSVLITALNEAKNLPRCLNALKYFNEIVVIDSGSSDATQDIARNYGARVEPFNWNGGYPKKRQWCLDNLTLKSDFIFFVDADEEVTPELVEEIRTLDFKKTGYFVKGQYCWNEKILRHGLQNNKLVLFDKNKIEFPAIDDLGTFCMGEMEGHYQPVLKQTFKEEPIGQLSSPLTHFAYEDEASWTKRHKRYAKWEAGMITQDAYPQENSKTREFLKRVFRTLPLRGDIAFIHSYIIKLGFLDGGAGFQFAKSRRDYYRMVQSSRLRA